MSVLNWLDSNGGWHANNLIGLKDFGSSGTGAVALDDIAPETTLFTIPHASLLSPCHSDLRPLLSSEVWEQLEEDGGWASLILCLMWEDARGDDSRWRGYLESLPTRFDTPLYWSEEDLRMLQGTEVIGRIGLSSTVKLYEEKILPIIHQYPSIFPVPANSSSPSSPTPFSLQDFQIQGSRILSRGFSVSRIASGRKPPRPETSSSRHKHRLNNQEGDGDVSMESVNSEKKSDGHGQEEDEEGSGGESSGEDDEVETDDEDEEGMEEVMVPVADMLNAAYERDNARLYHEKDCLKMITTKAIAKGEQIFNTYGSPPNSDLLRKYGHVDVYPLSPYIIALDPEIMSAWPYGNEGDEVMLSAEMVGDAAAKIMGGEVKGGAGERVEWWTDEGYDDEFPLTLSENPFPEELISLIRLFVDEDAWAKAKKKGKVPKPKIEHDEIGGKIVKVLVGAVEIRGEMYGKGISFEQLADRLMNHGQEPLPLNEYNAKVVEVGERRICLYSSAWARKLEQRIAADAAQAVKGKRKAEASSGGSKKAKR